MSDTTPSRTEDVSEIRELLDAYTQTINLRDWGRLGSLFTEDAIWDVRGVRSPNPFYEGNAALVSGISAAVDKYDMLTQMNHAPLIEIEGDRATAYSTINEVGSLNEDSGLFLLGTYQDDIRRIDGRWRFKRRIFQATYKDNKPVAGQVIVRGGGRP